MATEKKFAKRPNKNIEAQQLRALIERKLNNLIRLNASRYDFLDRFQKIEAYNSGALSIEQLFAELVTFTKDLLAKLKTEKLVLAWRTKRTTRAAVRVEIEKMLDRGLPEKYTSELFEQKCGVLFQHVLEKYPESGVSVYEVAG